MQNIKKYFMTLALLLTAVTGAWAQDPNAVTAAEIKSDLYSGWSSIDEKLFKASDLPGFQAVTEDQAKSWTGVPSTGKVKLFYEFVADGQVKVVIFKDGVYDESYEEEDLTCYLIYEDIAYMGETRFFYTTGPAPTEWSLKPDETGKTWTLAEMPASNVELQVEYYAESNLFLGKEALADKTNIAVTAGETTVDFDPDGKSTTTVTEGTPMTVKFNGTKKVLGFKAAKKAPTEGHALSASAVGEIVGSDGKAYAVADKDNLPSGVTAVAMVAYKSGSNGLAIQLNSSPVQKNWDEAKTYVEGLTAVSGGTWRLPSKADWQNMFVSCAVSGDASASDDMNPIAGFKAKIAATGITWQTHSYWSSTGSDSSAWLVGVNLGDSTASATFIQGPPTLQVYVRACLAF